MGLTMKMKRRICLRLAIIDHVVGGRDDGPSCGSAR